MTITRETNPRVLNPAIGIGRLGDDASAIQAAEAYVEALSSEISLHNFVAAMMSSLDGLHEEFYGVGLDADLRLTGRVYTDLGTRVSDMDARVFAEAGPRVILPGTHLSPDSRPEIYSPGTDGETILESEYLIGSFQAIEHFRPHDSHDLLSPRAFAVHIEGRTRTMIYIKPDSSVGRKVMRKGLGR